MMKMMIIITAYLTAMSAASACPAHNIVQDVYTAPVPGGQHEIIAGLGDVWIVTRCDPSSGAKLRALSRDGVLDNANRMMIEILRHQS